jgi:hypothetical protein
MLEDVKSSLGSTSCAPVARMRRQSDPHVGSSGSSQPSLCSTVPLPHSGRQTSTENTPPPAVRASMPT